MAKRDFLRLMWVTMAVLCCLVVPAFSFNDPMRPTSYQPVSSKAKTTALKVDTSDWILSAVLISESRTVALVNGKALQVGDFVQGFRLTKIFTDRVVLQKNKTKVILTRAGAGLKNRSAAEGSRK